MKVRTGFVSNSSSSSFTCDICKRTVSGWDLGLSEANMAQCVNGHVFCTEHQELPNLDDKPWQERRDMLAEYAYREETKEAIRKVSSLEELERDWDGYWTDFKCEIRYDVPANYCPLCQFEDLPDEDLAKWAVASKDVSRQELVKMLKDKYGDYEAFKEAIE